MKGVMKLWQSLYSPIRDNFSGGSRPTQQVTIKMVNTDSINTSNVLIQGYFLNKTGGLYMCFNPLI